METTSIIFQKVFCGFIGSWVTNWCYVSNLAVPLYILIDKIQIICYIDVSILVFKTMFYFYKVRLQVQDGGFPNRYDTAILTVSVNRNRFSPAFDPLNYNITIYEDQALGEEIIRVFATDTDTRSPHNIVRYEALDSSSGIALTYFGIQEVDGVIFVRRSLRSDNLVQNSFTVSCILKLNIQPNSNEGLSGATEYICLYEQICSINILIVFDYALIVPCLPVQLNLQCQVVRSDAFKFKLGLSHNFLWSFGFNH